MKKQNAFTLAEVLITLGIIGVVAAMTLPTLLNSVQGSQYRAQLKKAMSSLSNALVMSVAQDDYDAGTATSTGSGTTDQSLYNIYKTKLHVTDISNSDTWAYTKAAVNNGGANNSSATIGGANNYTFMMNDGSVISFLKSNKECTGNACKAIIDVNGQKGPNKEAACSNSESNIAVTNCEIKLPADVYPIVIEPQAVRLTTVAGQASFGKGK